MAGTRPRPAKAVAYLSAARLISRIACHAYGIMSARGPQAGQSGGREKDREEEKRDRKEGMGARGADRQRQPDSRTAAVGHASSGGRFLKGAVHAEEEEEMR